MKTKLAAFTLLLLALLSLTACFRDNTRTITIQIPDMETELDARIATNAAIHELAFVLDGIPSDAEIDLSQNLLYYHETPRLLNDRYLRHMKHRLEEVGFEVQFLQVGLDELPPIPTKKGPAQPWPGRSTLIMHIPNMTTIKDANRAIDAMAYARFSSTPSLIKTDPKNRIITIDAPILCGAIKNYEAAIASAGYTANTMTPLIDLPDGWSPL